MKGTAFCVVRLAAHASYKIALRNIAEHKDKVAEASAHHK